ncbi:hypothetical protein D3C87_852990 [compost metagenome]|uniref:DUF6265 family protein n=1 Tax=Pedobacter ghigonis TaxID=2730403 RepID=UPI000FA19B3E|nr:DUF6265 family protein [Pedobacter ghigonis]
MKNTRLTLLTLLLIGFSTLANAQKAPSKTLAFVLGSWEMQTSKGKIVEQWVRNPDKTLSGKSYRINAKGDSTLTETLKVRNVGKDTFYCSTVNGQNEGKEVCFKLISTTDQTYVFENKMHDFPQRIVYQDKGKREMLAWIEGELNGKSRKSEFKYIRK